MNQLPQSLAALRGYNQFILVKQDKVPVAGNPHDPANWLDADTAIRLANEQGHRVGFVFTPSDPFWFLDIDHCTVMPSGQWSDTAQYFLNVLQGAAVEVSQSGEGLHLFGSNAAACGVSEARAKKNKEYGIELYTEGRFVLLTGTHASGDITFDAGSTLPAVVSHFFPKSSDAALAWRDTPVEGWNGPPDDDILISKMMNTGAGFGDSVTFADLWNANESKLAQRYPSETDVYDRSSADAALFNHLAFWTGKNHARMWNLAFRSALRRDKWDPAKHKSYLQNTIINAANSCRNVYSSQRQEAVAPQQPQIGTGVELTTGGAMMTVQLQLDHFKHCYYLERRHRVFIPNGNILKPEAFKAIYGGYEFVVTMDNSRTVRNAFEAFTESQAVRHPKVRDLVFDPTLPPYQIVEKGGERFVNAYVPINIPRKKGDASPFIIQVRKLFPSEDDYQIIMAYMAAMVQHVGVKFQWCPVIQGAEGNGKSFLNRAVAKTLGDRYCHFPNASDLAGNGLKFNGWVEGNLGIFIEEVYVGSSRFDLLDGMKPLITNKEVEIQRKGQDQYTGQICCNFMLNTNHEDAIKDSADQRRYWINYTPQQTYADILRDGMTPEYFFDLYNWAEAGGWEIISDFLLSYEIPDHLNPATRCSRAPNSSTKARSVYATLGPAQQEIVEAIEEGRQGFRGGYVSTKGCTILLKEAGHRFAPRTLGKLITELGYMRHPGLRDGRTPSNVLAEGTRPILYVRIDSGVTVTGFSMQDEIQQDYETRQGYQNGS